jgi:hypothetical protein
MKRIIIILALTLIGVSAFSFQAFAEEETKESAFTYEVGADLVSSYLWRGQNLGGLSIQPSVTLGWKGLYLCTWANIGADNWRFKNLNPELDITIGYDNYGVQLDLTHLYYFYGDNYFKGLGDPNNNYKDEEGNLVESATTMELHAGINVGEWVEKVPLSIDWYTTVLGFDPIFNEQGEIEFNENGNAKRAWSTYIQVGYDITLPFNIILGIKVGFTPWKGMYSDYEEVWKNGQTIGINNIQLRAEREFELKGICLNVWGEAMFNCYGVNKNNIIKTFGEASSQKLNACIGLGVYFGN